MAIGTPASIGSTLSTSSGSTLVLTTTANIAAGDLVVLFWNCTSTSHGVTSVVDSGATNTYTNVVGATTNSEGGMAYCTNAAALASGQTITANLDTTGLRIALAGIHVTGMSTNSSLVYDKRGFATQQASATTTPLACTYPASASSNSMLIFGTTFLGATNPGTVTPNGSFAQLIAGSAGAYQFIDYVIVTNSSSPSWQPTFQNSASYRNFLWSFLGAQASNTSRQAQGTLCGVGQ